jgi:CRP-like cAMP-binding protein
MTSYIEKIDELVNSFDEATQAALESISASRQLKKGTYLLKQGEICRRSYFLTNGIARKFFVTDNKEITTEFYFANDIAVSLNSYVFQQAGVEAIECLTDVTVAQIDYLDFQHAKKKHPALLEFDFMLTELYALWLEERLFDFHTLNATQRYKKLIQKSPEVLQHIKLTHIASYLGISLETLSRVRSRT